MNRDNFFTFDIQDISEAKDFLKIFCNIWFSHEKQEKWLKKDYKFVLYEDSTICKPNEIFSSIFLEISL